MRPVFLARFHALPLLAGATALLTGCDGSATTSSTSSGESSESVRKTAPLVDAGEHWVWEGDILLSKTDPDHRELAARLGAEASGSEGILARAQGVSSSNPIKSWPGGAVSYVFTGTNWTTAEKNFMRAQMAKYTAIANITWTEKTSAGNYVVSLVKQALVGGSCGIGGSATAGYTANTTFTLGADLTLDSMTIVHELGHVLGFGHEHSRPDRDTYITINTSNLVTDIASNFTTKYAAPLLYTGYDVFSVLHYKSYSEAPSGCSAIDATKPMLLRKDGGAVLNRGMSNLDRQMVAMVYGAKGPMARTQPNGIRLATYTGASIPTDIGVSSSHYYYLRGTKVDQVSRTSGSVTGTVTTGVDAIDYVNSTYGLVGASNASKQIRVDLFGSVKNYPYPSGVTTVRRISGYASGGELRVILAIPAVNYGARETEYRVTSSGLVATGKTYSTGYYENTDLATDGSTLLASSAYYWATISRLDWATGTLTKEKLSQAWYTSHSFFDPVAYTWPEVRPTAFDAGTNGGAWGIFSLVPGSSKTHVVFVPIAF